MENTKKIIILKVIDILEFLMMLVVFIDVNSVYTEAIFNNKLPTQSGVHNYARLICFALAAILIGMHVAYDKANIECIKKYKNFAIFQGIYLFLFYVLNVMQAPDGTGYIESFFLFMTVMPLLFKMYRREGKSFSLLYKLEYIVLFVAIVSTLLWFGSSILNLLGESEDIRVLWGGNYYDSNYINLCFRRYWVEDLTKNLGIFAEPPMFGLFLSIAFYTELFLKKRSNIYIIVALFGGLISCRATLALMIALMGIILKILELLSDKKWVKYAVIALGLIGVAGVIALFLYKKDVSYSSWGTHLDDFVAPVKCFIHNNWIVGCGYDYMDPIIKYQSAFRSNNPGMSNSIAAVLAQGGLMLSAYYLAPLIVIISAFFKKKRKLAYWGLGMLALYVTVIFYLRVLVFVLLALGYSMIDIEVFKNKPFVKFSIDYPDDNIVSNNEQEKIRWYDKCLLRTGFKMPAAMNFVLLLFTMVVSVFTVTAYAQRSISSIVCAVITLVISIALIVWRLYLYKNNKHDVISKYVNVMYIAMLCIYAAYICVGHMYAITENILRNCGLLLQDSQWSFVIFVMLTYIVISIGDCVIKCHNNKNKDYIK